MKPCNQFKHRPCNSGATTSSSSYNRGVAPSPASLARRSLLRRIHKQELRKLKSLLPRSRQTPLAKRSGSCRRSEVDEEMDTVLSAASYIDQLHAAVLARVRAGSLSPGKKSLVVNSFTTFIYIHVETCRIFSTEFCQLLKETKIFCKAC